MFQDRLQAVLVPAVQKAFLDAFGAAVDPAQLAFQPTRPEFEGDITINVFPFLKLSGKGPEPTAQAIGEHLQAHVDVVERFNVIKGFLNIVIADGYWLEFLSEARAGDILQFARTGRKVMVEYSSPNTNKPLHLGHLRNDFLGHSVSRILLAVGHEVVKVQVINDRGIHICKSMLAWRKFGNGETPDGSGTKGDKLVGKYYVEFDQWSRRFPIETIAKVSEVLASERARQVLPGDFYFHVNLTQRFWEIMTQQVSEKMPWQEFDKRLSTDADNLREDTTNWLTLFVDRLRTATIRETLNPEGLEILDRSVAIVDEALKNVPIRLAQEMLRQWEANDPEVRALWEKMNGWVYDGFQKTYDRIGVEFDKWYYESETYVLGKQDVLEGLKKGVFYEKDGAVWVDNRPEGLDEKVLLRRDGTSVYMTQDIGTAVRRFEEYPGLAQLIYVVGNEQDYHFKTLFTILKKLGYPWAKELFHLSYGMVDLPSGKMKSREGTVVDADDLVEEMVDEARKTGEQLGKLEAFNPKEKAELFEMIGLAALKYFLLKVDPKKRMLFDPAASIDLQGHTGPFIQYTHARIKSLLRKSAEMKSSVVSDRLSGSAGPTTDDHQLLPEERAILKLLHQMPAVLHESATRLDPSSLANQTYELVKTYNTFYQTVPVMKEEDEGKRGFRLALSAAVATVIQKAMWCLGIEVPERM